MRALHIVIPMVLLILGISHARALELSDFSPEDQARLRAAQCGWYIVLGCGKSEAALYDKMDEFGGPYAGGGAGMDVVNTDNFPNFRNGFYCLVDGPYSSQDAAQSIAWKEAVPDAYVKKGC